MNIYSNLEILPEDLQGWNGTSEVFKTLISKTVPSVIVEVGTWKGQSAITMGKAVKELNLSSKIYCVDTWLGAVEFITTLKDTPERDLQLKNGYPQVYYQFLSNVVHSSLQDSIIPIPNTSITGAKYLKYNNVIPQLIYIDASHEEEDVFADLQLYYSLLADGGIIFGDDYNHWEGVRRAVEKFSLTKGITFEILENNFWVINKNTTNKQK